MKTTKKNIATMLAIAFFMLSTSFFTTPSIASSQSHVSAFQASDHWALCVGIGVYAENPEQDRPLMLDEVQDFAQTLIDGGWQQDHIKIIKGEEATERNILAGFRWLQSNEDSDDVSLVFISTHGSPLYITPDQYIDLPPRDEADGADEMLITYWGFSFSTSFLWDDEINFELNRLQSQGVCLIVDSCYAGGFNDHGALADEGSFQQTASQYMTGFIDDVKGQNRIILMGCREDEEAYSGNFAPWLIDALRGYGDINHDNVVTAEEAFNYTLPRPFEQTPTIYDGYPGELVITQATGQRSNTEMLTSPPKRSIPHQTAVSTQVCGYIKDAETLTPLEGATINIHGRTNDYDQYENETVTNETGFYVMSVPAGRYRATASAAGYCDRSSSNFNVYEGQIRWVNLSLFVRPEENASVHGFITDEVTSEPLEGAAVTLYWEGGVGQSYHNTTLTDSLGSYSLNAASGSVWLSIEADQYFDEAVEDLTLADFETLWMNASLTPHPAETAVIKGYLTDSDSGAPLVDAQITYQWMDFETGHSYMNDTTSDIDGFYSIMVAPGELYREIRSFGYEPYDPYRHDGQANTTSWQNISVERQKPTFGFLQPLNALYIKNKRVLPMSKSIVFGSVDVAVYFQDMWYGGGDVEKVEFYLDGELKSTVTEEPFNWTWSQKSIGKHVVKVIAYDFDGDTASREIEVRKFL